MVLVEPSALGIQALDDAEGIKLDRVRSICDRLDDDQLRRLVRTVGDLRGAIAAEFGFADETAPAAANNG